MFQEENNKNDVEKKIEKPGKLNLEKYFPKQNIKNEPAKQIIKENNTFSNFNLLKNLFENTEKKNEKEKNEKKVRISYKKEETPKIKEFLNSNKKEEEKRKENINKIEEFKSNNVQRFLLNLKNNEIFNKEKELHPKRNKRKKNYK